MKRKINNDFIAGFIISHLIYNIRIGKFYRRTAERYDMNANVSLTICVRKCYREILDDIINRFNLTSTINEMNGMFHIDIYGAQMVRMIKFIKPYARCLKALDEKISIIIDAYDCCRTHERKDLTFVLDMLEYRHKLNSTNYKVTHRLADYDVVVDYVDCYGSLNFVEQQTNLQYNDVERFDKLEKILGVK